MLARMRYKRFTWPNNPKTYTISYTRAVPVTKIPYGLYSLQDLGRTARQMTGTGEFYGAEAYDTFKRLASVFYQKGPGVLVHPIWQAASAYFTELELTQEPRADYVAYRFTFVEGLTPVGQTQTTRSRSEDAAKIYARGGDTAWSLAAEFGLTVRELMQKNPQISNPNLIMPGTEVYI